MKNNMEKEKFEKFIEKNKGFLTPNWNSFCGGSGGYLFCPICQKEKIGQKVSSNGKDEDDLCFSTNGNLRATLDIYKNIWFIKFKCSRCNGTHYEFKRIWDYLQF